MSPNIVVDMNLSPEWMEELANHEWAAIHWSSIGKFNADDSVIMAWALANSHIVLTQDLDFGVMLALTHAAGPSVVQVRGPFVLPEDIGPVVVAALNQHSDLLQSGALVVVDVKKTRVRVLPLS